MKKRMRKEKKERLTDFLKDHGTDITSEKSLRSFNVPEKDEK